METYITLLIYVHAFLGGLGLLAGQQVLSAKKGTKPTGNGAQYLLTPC